MPLHLKNGYYSLFILLFFCGIGFAQEINQFDDQGNRNGKWKKYYKGTDQVRYEGTFEHGKEVGIFKFYEPDSGDQPRAIKTYNTKNDTVILKFFNSNGILKSTGKMVGKKREGEWNYYNGSQEKLVMTEHYKNDKLEEWKIIYFDNGKVTQKLHYKDGRKDGKKLVYRKSGELWQKYHYHQDTLQGKTKTFDRDGKIKSKGQYKKGLRNGKWAFYTNGKLDSIATYKMDYLSENQKKTRRKKEDKRQKESE